MNWRCESSGRVPALQAQSPEFKPHSHRKRERQRQRERDRDRERERDREQELTSGTASH
jgi:hypothetical protein